MGPVALSPWVTVEPCVGIIWTIIHYDYDADDEFDCYDDAHNHHVALSPWVTVEPCWHHYHDAVENAGDVHGGDGDTGDVHDDEVNLS